MKKELTKEEVSTLQVDQKEQRTMNPLEGIRVMSKDRYRKLLASFEKQRVAKNKRKKKNKSKKRR